MYVEHLNNLGILFKEIYVGVLSIRQHIFYVIKLFNMFTYLVHMYIATYDYVY